MKRHLDNARNFEELSDPEKVELLIAASGIPLFVIGSGLLLLTDQLFIGAAFVAFGILDLTIIPRVISRSMELEAEADSA